jgi:hypothetical protein
VTTVRVRFEQGRLLAAADLRADVAFESTLRERHVRAIHDSWGIALGYSLAIDAFGMGVFVGPGVGYDRCGRALVSDTTVHVPAANNDGPVLLVVRPPDPMPGCPGPVDRHQVGWRWRTPGGVGDDEVALARFSSDAGTLSDLDLTVRRGAVRRRNRRVATGVHRQEGWFPDQAIEVDTTAAGFTRTPFYFATLVATAATQELFGPRPGVLGPWPHLHSATQRRFELTLRFGGAYESVSGIGAGETFEVHWIGVEPARDCPEPELDPATARSAIGGRVPSAPASFVPQPPTGGSQPTEDSP